MRGQFSGRVRVRSFRNTTGSVTPTVTPERSHAWRVHATGSKPGGRPPRACAGGLRDEDVGEVFLVLGAAAMLVMADRYTPQTTTSSAMNAYELLYVLWTA